MATGIILKTTVTGSFELFRMVSSTLPVPDVLFIEIPGGIVGTDQLKIVPATGDKKIILACVPEQMAVEEAGSKVTDGIGFTITEYVSGLMGEQPLSNGVI